MINDGNTNDTALRLVYYLFTGLVWCYDDDVAYELPIF